MSSFSPIVSVILPFFNAQKTLSRAIESISNQVFINFECLLINNNSTDKSCTIAMEWTQKDSRFKLIHEKQQGVMFASNKGSRHAKGKYIARMDADDESLPARLKEQAEFLDKYPNYGAVSGLVEYMPHNANTEGFQRYVNWVNSVQNHQDILNNMFVESPIVNPTAMWRREVAEKYGMYKSGDFPEDYELWLRWLSLGVKITKVNSSVIKWYDSESRLTRTNAIYSDEAFYNIKTKYLAQWLQKHNLHYPEVAVWGASRISRKHIHLLNEHGIKVNCYIDIKKSRQLNLQVIFYEDLPLAGSIFILIYIKNHDAKKKIRDFLNIKNYSQGKDYIFVS